jgi:hypothetical protein
VSSPDTPSTDDFGTATLDPTEDVIAGCPGTWRLTYTAGNRGVDPGGRIRVYSDSDTDRAQPQFSEPSGPDYTTVSAPEGVQVDALVQPYKTLLLALHGAPLRPGDRIVVTYGDTSGGSPGLRAQTFLEDRHNYIVSVSPSAGEPFHQLPDPPYHAIVGGDIDRLEVIAPSTAVVDRPFRLLVKAEDAWGNPATRYRGRVSLVCDAVDLPESTVEFTDAEAGLRWLENCVPKQVGLFTVLATDETGDVIGQSNPISITAEPEAFDLYWGDYHGGQVENAEKITDFFRYARDVAGIQFASYQRNDNAHSDEDYALQLKVEKEYHEPGRFVAIPGYEWSPATRVGGHHNVYFRRFDQPMRRWTSARLSGHDTSNDLPHVRDLYEAYRNTDTVITPHVGGNHSNLHWHDPTLEPAVEITSDHGTFEWMLQEILERNYRMGFFGGSDSHTGRPGGDGPGHQHRRYAKSGLAGVYAKDVTIEALLDALVARRVFATTGARIQLRTMCEGHPMGTEFKSSSLPKISAFVAGTSPLESVELYRGLDKIHSYPIDTPTQPTRVRVLWEGSSRKSSYAGVVWEGTLEIKKSRMSNVRKVRFDSPRSFIFNEQPDGLAWSSVTCGYRSGFVFDLDTPEAELFLTVSTSVITGPKFGEHGEDGPLRIAHAPAERVASTINVADLATGPRVIEIGTLNRRVIVSLAPEPTIETVELSFTDSSPVPGINPYWLRVLQVDQEMAWSSPIYVDYAAQV